MASNSEPRLKPEPPMPMKKITFPLLTETLVPGPGSEKVQDNTGEASTSSLVPTTSNVNNEVSVRGDEFIIAVDGEEWEPARGPTENEGNEQPFAWVVHCIYCISLLVYVATVVRDGCGGNAGFIKCGISLFIGPQTDTLLKFGGLENRHIVNLREYLRVWASLWLNDGVLALSLLFVSLFFSRKNLTRRFGSRLLIFICVVCGTYSNLMTTMFIRIGTFTGSSGAISGLSGASLIYLIMNWRTEGSFFELFMNVGGFIVQLGLSWLLPHMNVLTTVVGYIGGGFIQIMLGAKRQGVRRFFGGVMLLQIIGLMVLLFLKKDYLTLTHGGLEQEGQGPAPAPGIM